MFGGGGSIQLARVFGIRVGVEPSWFLILFVIIWSLTGYYGDLFPDQGTSAFVLAVVSALLFFGSIVLHELGHAVVAMRNGIKIEGIDLWLFGGVAKLSKDTDSAGVEFRVAAAGPAVTAADRGGLLRRRDADLGLGRGRRLGPLRRRSPATRRWRCWAT